MSFSSVCNLDWNIYWCVEMLDVCYWEKKIEWWQSPLIEGSWWRNEERRLNPTKRSHRKIFANEQSTTWCFATEFFTRIFWVVIQLDPVLIFIILQLHLHISYPTFQSVLLLLMFIEVIVIMARNDYHPRVLRAVRPFFFINSYLMYDLRRWVKINFSLCVVSL